MTRNNPNSYILISHYRLGSLQYITFVNISTSGNVSNITHTQKHKYLNIQLSSQLTKTTLLCTMLLSISGSPAYTEHIWNNYANTFFPSADEIKMKLNIIAHVYIRNLTPILWMKHISKNTAPEEILNFLGLSLNIILAKYWVINKRWPWKISSNISGCRLWSLLVMVKD